MSEMKHTTGPWRVGTPPPNGEQTIGNKAGLMVAVATTGHGVSSEANARRIVACVNACEGISTTLLEHGAKHDWAVLMTELEARIAELEAQQAAMVGGAGNDQDERRER